MSERYYSRRGSRRGSGIKIGVPDETMIYTPETHRRRFFSSPYRDSKQNPGTQKRKFVSVYAGSKPESYFGGGVISKYARSKGNKKKEGGLADKTLAGASFAAIVGGLVYSFSTITGHAIGNLNVLDTNIMGTILFILGVAGLLVYLRRKS